MRVNRHMVAAATLVGGLALAGCAGVGAGMQGGGAQGAGMQDVVEASPTLADVNGAAITQADLDFAFNQLPPNLKFLGKERIQEPLLNQLVENQLLAAEGEALALDQDPEVLNKIRRYRTIALRQAYVENLVAEKVTDDTLRARYEETIAAQERSPEVHARHILLENEEDAKAVIAELEAGADFAELARTRSTGPSASNGGDLGFFKKGDMVPPFAEAAFAMEPGEISKTPVQTQFGWHVIEVLERRTPEPPAFDAMRNRLESDMRREVLRTRLDELREVAQIMMFDGDGNPIVEDESADGDNESTDESTGADDGDGDSEDYESGADE